MQKTWTKWLAFVLAAVMLFSVAACGDKPQDTSDPQESSEASVPGEDSSEPTGGDSTSDASQAEDPASADTDATATTGSGNVTVTSGKNTTTGSKGGSTKATTTKNGETTKKTTAKASGKTVTFADLDLSNLKGLKEADGANSGAKGNIYVINASNIRAHTANWRLYYDTLKFMVSLQGLENRNGQQKIYFDDSSAWFNFFRATTDGLLYGKKRVDIKDTDVFIKTFEKEIKAHGIVLWDPEQPFTSNIATNVCGVEGYLPVMYDDDEDSIYSRLTEKFGASIVKMDLRGKFTGKKGSKIWDTSVASSGSAKCDAYLWAMEKYVKTGKTSKAFIAYMVDFYPLSPKGKGQYLDNSDYETYLPSQDFVVQNAIFTFDLSPWGDEPATDDPTQESGLDYRTLQKLCQYQYDRNGGAFSQCIGFPGFVYKYTKRIPGGNHDDTAVEWETVEVMSAYNIALQADCPGPSSLYNCSVYSQYKQQMTYSQAAKRKKALDHLPAYDKNSYYIYFYFGDYDAASWTYNIAAGRLWQQKRGEIPLAWAFNPNLMERIPMVWDYFYATATDKDYFIGGDSGAGYINPSLLQAGKRQHSSLPDGLNQWATWCKKWYKKADLSISGFILNGTNPYSGTAELDAYATFSPDGIGIWNWPGQDSGLHNYKGIGVSGMDQSWGISQSGTAEQGANALLDVIDNRRTPHFYPIKCNICSPELAAESVKLAQKKLAAEGKGRKLVVLDPYTYFAMVAREAVN